MLENTLYFSSRWFRVDNIFGSQTINVPPDHLEPKIQSINHFTPAKQNRCIIYQKCKM